MPSNSLPKAAHVPALSATNSVRPVVGARAQRVVGDHVTASRRPRAGEKEEQERRTPARNLQHARDLPRSRGDPAAVVHPHDLDASVEARPRPRASMAMRGALWSIVPPRRGERGPGRLKPSASPLFGTQPAQAIDHALDPVRLLQRAPPPRARGLPSACAPRRATSVTRRWRAALTPCSRPSLERSGGHVEPPTGSPSASHPDIEVATITAPIGWAIR